MSTIAKKKAAPKKKAVIVAGPVKSTIKSLLAEAKKYGITIVDEYDDDEAEYFDDDNSGNWEFEARSKNSRNNNFSFETRCVPFCCGVAEMGEFTIYNKTGLTARRKEELDVLIAYALLTIKEGFTTRKAGYDDPARTFGFIINTNGVDESIHIERAIEKYLSNHFKLATTFENKNSGNIIKTFVSIY